MGLAPRQTAREEFIEPNDLGGSRINDLKEIKGADHRRVEKARSHQPV